MISILGHWEDKIGENQQKVKREEEEEEEEEERICEKLKIQLVTITMKKMLLIIVFP